MSHPIVDSNSLKGRTLRALSWSFLESVSLRSVQFFTGILLARLLVPEQFGIVGMLTIFIAVAQCFLDSGFGTALIQKKEPTQTDFCSIFYFNILVALIAAGFLSLIAPWIAAFYGQPILTPLTRVLSLTIVINSFGLIQSTILTRKIDFKIQTKVSFLASVLSGIAGVALAATGFGVWSLAGQQLSAAFSRTVFLWIFHSWRPSWVFSLKSLREMFGFASRVLASGLLNEIFGNIYLLVIGKLFSAAALGFFSRAKSLEEFPSRTLAGMVGRVTLPVFSSMQDDRARVKRALKKALTTLVLVNFPMMIGLCLIARPLVLVLFTDVWSNSIPYFQLLSLGGMTYPLHLINLNILQALGRSDLFLRLEVIKKAFILMNIAVAWRWGLHPMVFGIVAISIISYYINSYYTGILIGYSIREQLLDLLPYLGAAGLMGLTVFASGLFPFTGNLSRLVFQIATGIFVYTFLCRFFRLNAFMEVWEAGRNRVSFLRARPAE